MVHWNSNTWAKIQHILVQRWETQYFFVKYCKIDIILDKTLNLSYLILKFYIWSKPYLMLKLYYLNIELAYVSLNESGVNMWISN